MDNGRLVVRHNVEDLQWLWSRFGMLQEGAAKARLAGVKPLEVGLQPLESGEARQRIG